MTICFDALRSGQKVVRLVKDSEFNQYLELIDHLESKESKLIINEAGFPVDNNGRVVCELKLPTHARHSEQHLHLSFAIKTLWLFNGNGDNGPCTFCIAIPSMPVNEFLCIEIRGLTWNGSMQIGYVYFSKTRGNSEVAEHWKLNVRNKMIAQSNEFNNKLEKIF
jgi:hypothetical protein